jgi:hypothetical protein
MGSFDWGSGFRGLKSSTDGPGFSNGGASHLIRSAEKLASSGRFDFAIEQLQVAQRLDPGNKYIQAIIDRIRVSQNEHLGGQPKAPAEKSNPLGVTIDPRSPNGILGQEEDSLASEDIPARVRHLTNVAEQFLESGSSEKAFESLMKAYLLDPLSPYVAASEKAILPVWENARRGSLSVDVPQHMKHQEGFISHELRGEPFSPGQQARVETLKHQKEQERQEKERSEWRDASKPLMPSGEDSGNTKESSQQAPQTGGLFSKLKLGKFLE